MKDYELELSDIIVHCTDVKSFRFLLKEDVLYRPGQYLVLTLPVEGKPVSKVFSISSSPTEKGFIQFTKKISSSPFSRELDVIKQGTICKVRFPSGDFIFEGQFQKVAFLIGGIGITPVRSMLRNAFDRKISSDIVLLYSASSEKYLIFRQELDLFQSAIPNIRVIYTLSECQEVRNCRKGYIDEDMVKSEIADYSDRVFYTCGPPAMVDAMKRLLERKLGLPEEKIVTEDFIGY